MITIQIIYYKLLIVNYLDLYLLSAKKMCGRKAIDIVFLQVIHYQ